MAASSCCTVAVVLSRVLHPRLLLRGCLPKGVEENCDGSAPTTGMLPDYSMSTVFVRLFSRS